MPSEDDGGYATAVMGDCGVYGPCGDELSSSFAAAACWRLRLRRPYRKNSAPMIAMPAMTPTTIPAIAPPESEEDPDDEAAAAAVVDVDVDVAVAVGEVSVEEVEVVMEVAVVEVGVGVGVADEEGSPLSMTWMLQKSLLASFFQAPFTPHDNPPRLSHLWSWYIEIQRFWPSGSHENGLFAASVICVQFEGPVSCNIVAFPVAFVYRNVQACARGTKAKAYIDSFILAARPV